MFIQYLSDFADSLSRYNQIKKKKKQFYQSEALSILKYDLVVA